MFNIFYQIKSNQIEILDFILSFQLNWNILLHSKLNACICFLPWPQGWNVFLRRFFSGEKNCYVLICWCFWPKKNASFYRYCLLVACKRNTTLASTETPKKKKQIHRPWNTKEKKALLKTFTKNIARLQVPGKKIAKPASSISVFGK